jgi:hypothetical protein
MLNPTMVRNFQYPGGRLWTLCLVHPEDGGPQVLRFAAGMRSFELKEWPEDWAEQPDEVLALLLRQAAPRRHDALPPSGSPRRRWNDREQSTS